MKPVTPLRLLLTLCTVLFALACENDAPYTQIRVIVDSDLAIGAELTRLEVRVYDRRGQTELRRQDFALAPERDTTRYTLPMSFKLAPDSQRSTSDFRLVVTGVGPLGPGGSDVTVVEQQALASFRPGEALRLDVFLGRSCLLTLCKSEDEAGLSPLTCDVGTGECIDVPVRDRLPVAVGDGLAQYEDERAQLGDAGAAVSQPDAAVGADAGVDEMDAGDEAEFQPKPDAHTPLEGGADAALRPPTDAAILETDSTILPEAGGDASTAPGDAAAIFDGIATPGSACTSESAKACAGNNSTDALVCEGGAWSHRAVCDGNNRCDTAAGTTRGTCQPIASQCIGKGPAQNVCVGIERFKCGADLLSIAPAPCPEHTECYEGSCICSDGYVVNASRTACIEADVPLQVCAGALSCVLLKSGRVACWKAGSLPEPTVVRAPNNSTLTAAKYLAVGENGACAVLADGRVACWGTGEYVPGGAELIRASLVKGQAGSDLDSISQVAVGGSHACALSTSGSVFCWGGNGMRQLGTASTASSVGHAEQVLGIGGSGVLSNVRQVAAGNLHTCARQLGNGVVCWGSNAQGRLGVNTAWPALPTVVPAFGNPVHISTTALSSSTCAVLDDGSVWCWGVNSQGQLGTGNVQDSPSPTRVLSAAGVPFAGAVEVALGFSSACARTASTVVCWGLNDHGQLGRPVATQQSLFAIAVPGLTGAVHLGQSSYQTNCVIMQNRQVLCWGATAVLDGSSAQDSSEPVPVWPAWDFVQ